MFNSLARFWLLAMAALASTPTLQAAQLENPTLQRCLISVQHEVEVPAQEAGVLVRLEAAEGVQVERSNLLAKIDDSQRQMQKRQALIEQQAAREEAENDINVRYAKAAARVAEAEYTQAVEANRQVTGTYPEAEIRRLKLAWHRAYLQIEQSQHEQRLATFRVESRAADVDAAETNIRRRTILAPVSGEVVALLKQAGEWVQPGEPVLRIVSYDTLRVEGFLNAKHYDPVDVAGRPVQVTVELARGRQVRFPGKITFVSSQVQAGGDYRLWAEVENRRDQGQWLLRPGLDARMTIEVKR